MHWDLWQTGKGKVGLARGLLWCLGLQRVPDCDVHLAGMTLCDSLWGQNIATDMATNAVYVLIHAPRNMIVRPCKWRRIQG